MHLSTKNAQGRSQTLGLGGGKEGAIENFLILKKNCENIKKNFQ